MGYRICCLLKMVRRRKCEGVYIVTVWMTVLRCLFHCFAFCFKYVCVSFEETEEDKC